MRASMTKVIFKAKTNLLSLPPRPVSYPGSRPSLPLPLLQSLPHPHCVSCFHCSLKLTVLFFSTALCSYFFPFLLSLTHLAEIGAHSVSSYVWLDSTEYVTQITAVAFVVTRKDDDDDEKKSPKRFGNQFSVLKVKFKTRD